MHRHLTVRPLRGIVTLAAVLFAAACADSTLMDPATTDRADAGPAFSMASADAFDGRVRIGVAADVSEVRVGGTGAFTVRQKDSGSVIVEGAGEEFDVALESTAVVRKIWRVQVTCSSRAGADDLVARAEAEGYATYMEDAGPCWRVMLGELPETVSFGEYLAFRNELIAKGLAGSDSFRKLFTIVEGSSALKITGGGEEIEVEPPIVVEPANGYVTIDGAPYRGIAEVALNSGGALAGINELPIREYLYGVVPLELPPVPYGEPEAQKAQAVAARTYTLRNLGKRSADGYDLLPTTFDQVYGGLDAESPVSSRAVDETAGIAAVHDGQLISALYHSTSGGHTANSEDVFTTALPYLRGVPDAQRGRAMEHVPSLEVFKNSANPASLRAMKNGDFESDWSQYHRWTFEWTSEEISEVVSAAFGTDVGHVLEINVPERANSGRVLTMEFVTENGTFYEEKDGVRSALKFFDDNGNMRSLLSTLVYVEPVVDRRTKRVAGFRAYGGGWGHGVGFSQTGAVGMASRGQGVDYEQILKHYYQGVELERRY